ncbi:nucleotidyltransferase domain-containing protein [Candidatus Daviesbacteria bacterium]|nr:nucleotidyltransferase domain-containing protein [Candidatus Daviesbacteria bacterium]
MIDNNLTKQINTALSKEPKIKLAYVLGSAVSGRVKKESDFDLAVVIDDVSRLDHKDVYNLISHISFPKDLDLSVVDKRSSPIFLFQVISTGKCIYQKSEQAKVYFEVFAARNYYDSAHIRKIYYSYLKDKFAYAG